MAHRDAPFSPNLLLQAMAPDDLDRLEPNLTRHGLEPRQQLVIADKVIEHIYFPESGVASIVLDIADAGPTEVGIFGFEGLSGMSALLRGPQIPHQRLHAGQRHHGDADRDPSSARGDG